MFGRWMPIFFPLLVLVSCYFSWVCQKVLGENRRTEKTVTGGKHGGNITPSICVGSFNVKVPFVCFMQINSRGNETSSSTTLLSNIK